MKDNNEKEGGKDMFTLAPDIEKTVKQLLLDPGLGDYTEVPNSDGHFSLVRVGTEVFQKAKEQGAFMFFLEGTEFFVCTKFDK